jgi:hypothetical protein
MSAEDMTCAATARIAKVNILVCRSHCYEWTHAADATADFGTVNTFELNVKASSD